MTSRYIKIIAIALINLFAQDTAWAVGEGVRQVYPDNFPTDQYIYAIQNIDTGEMGYFVSAREVPELASLLGVRTTGFIPGHIEGALNMMLRDEPWKLAEVLEAASRGDFAPLKQCLPETGKGQYVGGGFKMTEQGTVVNIFGTKAAGELADGTPTMNPLAPYRFKSWEALMEQRYIYGYYSSIARDTGKPLMKGEIGPFNSHKHNPDTINFLTKKAYPNFDSTICGINKMSFPLYQVADGYVPRPAPSGYFEIAPETQALLDSGQLGPNDTWPQLPKWVAEPPTPWHIPVDALKKPFIPKPPRVPSTSGVKGAIKIIEIIR